MKKGTEHITALIIDTNVLMRRILSNILQNEKGVILSGAAEFYDFKRVSEKIVKYQPDLLYLGIDPAVEGQLDLFYQLRHAFPELRIVLLTNLTREGAVITVEGLRNGAIDYVTKPEKENALILAFRHFQRRVTPSLLITPELKRKSENSGRVTGEKKESIRRLSDIGRMNPGQIDLIVLGSCIGGVPSLFEVVSTLPGNLHVPVVIVHHMPKIYTEVLAGELDKYSKLTVIEAKNGSMLLPGNVYVAPGGYHSVIRNEGGQKQIMLHKGPKEHKCRPSIDVLLRSAVQEYGEKILAVFLSAGGNDGLLGALKVLESGGILLVESPESALVSDLGQKVKFLNSRIKAIPVDGITKEILNMIQSPPPKHKYRFKRKGLNNSDWISGTIDA